MTTTSAMVPPDVCNENNVEKQVDFNDRNQKPNPTSEDSNLIIEKVKRGNEFYSRKYIQGNFLGKVSYSSFAINFPSPNRNAIIILNIRDPLFKKSNSNF